MIGLAISALWLLIGIIVVALVLWLILYGLKNIAGIPIPDRVEQAVWFIFMILCIIGVLSLIGGGLHAPLLR